MKPGRIEGATRNFGAPDGWDADVLGPCHTLPIRDELTTDGLTRMTSAWLPNSEELAQLAAGAPVHLSIYGTGHPVVSMGVGIAPPSLDQPPPPGYSKLADGMLCRCPKMWKYGNAYYCCQPRK